jgi:hypothetical protein
LATVIVDDEINNSINMFLHLGHFKCHGGLPVQYEVHCLMQHVQGYSGSHWMPPSGNYLLHIAPAATRATANKTTTTTKKAKKTGHFDGHGGVPVQHRAHCLIEVV